MHLLLALNLKPCWIHLKADVLPLRGCDHSPQQRFQQLLQICSTIDLCVQGKQPQRPDGHRNAAEFWKLSTAWKHFICFGISQIPVKLGFAYYTLTSGTQPRSISTGILINFQLEKNNNPANQQTFFLRALTPHFTSVCTQFFKLKWEHKQDLRIYQEQSSSWHWPRTTHIIELVRKAKV